ncbi:MAG: geranylgeranyl reductase family protein [Proteobacteria bacterium]|nr:geranylgeranyl reductase family protein [Pseudomonadota bacterium]
MKTLFDVIIIGAGPGGSEMAYRLASRGWQVLVLEKAHLTREKSCGGGIQPQEIVEFGELPDDVIERSIDSARIYSPDKGFVQIPEYSVKGATVKRCVFDAYLQERARLAGARFLEKHAATDFEYTDGLATITVKHETGHKVFQGRLIVYAAGANPSQIKKKLNIPAYNPARLYVAVQKWIKFEKGILDDRVGDTIEIYAGSNIIADGYGWIFPKMNMVSVGIGTHKEILTSRKINLHHALNNLLYSHPIIKEKMQGGEVVRSDGGLIPAEPLEKIFYPGIIFIGDAAGFGNALHGGGIYQARKSALIADEYVDMFLRNNEEKYLFKYEKEAIDHFWTYQNKWDNKMLTFFWKDRLLNSTVSLAKKGNKHIMEAFAIILNSTESHKKAYEIMEKTMLDIFYDFLRDKAKPYRELLDGKLKQIEFEELLLHPSISHILFSDAKRFRATLSFLAYQLFADDLEEVLPIAVAYELLHTASLIHDDVMDNSQKRRGKQAVHVKFGTDAAITAGDSLIFKAYQVLNHPSMAPDLAVKIIDLFSKSGIMVSEGQALDIYLSNSFSLWSMPNYFKMIELKTGSLIDAPLMAGAMAGHADSRQINRLSRIGKKMGMAFQIIDDSNDMLIFNESSLKSLYTDIHKGKCTIILARCYEQANEKEKKSLENIMSSKELTDSDVEYVLSLCGKYETTSFAQNVCKNLTNECENELRAFPANKAREDLLEINEMISDWAGLSLL